MLKHTLKNVSAEITLAIALSMAPAAFAGGSCQYTGGAGSCYATSNGGCCDTGQYCYGNIGGDEGPEQQYYWCFFQ